MIVKKLYWNKYRPKNIDGMILLPRIQDELLDNDGNIVLSGNYLFTGTSGIGKTTLAKIIVPEGALIVNASYNSSVEDLKDVVIDYCRTSDIFGDSTIDGYKIVFLDEFDGVSQKYQEALRAFIEEYSDRIRFIATCNNLTKISSAMQSRFNVIKFDPINNEEVQYLKDGYLERCELIVEKNELNVSTEQLKSIINLTFPDLRNTFKILQKIEKTGKYSTELNSGLNLDLFEIIFGQINPEKTYNWVIENYGDNVEGLLKMCARPLSEYIFLQENKHVSKVPKIMKIVATYTSNLSACVDPVIQALSCIYEIQEIINTK